MKIAIVGSRDYSCPNLVKETLDEIIESFVAVGKSITIISGGARGVDTWAEETAKSWNTAEEVNTIIYEANWEKYGKSAGFRRNESIISSADSVLAFWDGKSKGTKHSIDLAIKAGKPVNIYVRNS